MARGNDYKYVNGKRIGGWDFVQVGQTYQFKEEHLIAMVKVMEDNSSFKEYRFKLRVEKANYPPPQNGEFKISQIMDSDTYYSGMSQIFENEVYPCEYRWIREQE